MTDAYIRELPDADREQLFELLGADAESGVVEPLRGDYRPDHDPIRVWQRADGSLQVISGRHRLDAARRAGASRIMSYVYREDAAHDLVVCPTPAVMRMVGARGWDMVVTPGVLDKVTKGKHSVSAAALEQLPAALSDPICVAVSDTPGCLEVVTEL